MLEEIKVLVKDREQLDTFLCKIIQSKLFLYLQTL